MKPLNAKEIRKGTDDVLKDILYAQEFMEDFRESGFPGRLGLEMAFVERALRVAMQEIRQLRERVERNRLAEAPDIDPNVKQRLMERC